MKGGTKEACRNKSKKIFVLQNWPKMAEMANIGLQWLKMIDNWPKQTKMGGNRPKLLTIKPETAQKSTIMPRTIGFDPGACIVLQTITPGPDHHLWY